MIEIKAPEEPFVLNIKVAPEVFMWARQEGVLSLPHSRDELILLHKQIGEALYGTE